MLLDPSGRPIEVPAPSSPVTREDRWMNFSTGVGTWMDKSQAGLFMPVCRLTDAEIANLYNGSDLAAKVIEKRPYELFRRGFDVEAKHSKETKGVDQTEMEEFREWATETFAIETLLREGKKWGAAWGGLLLTFGLDDGRDPWEPLDESRVRDITYINPVDRRFAYAESYYSRLDQPKYGQPEIYLISNGVATSPRQGKRSSDDLKRSGYAIGRIHESRCIRFDGHGADVLTQQLLAGWSWSVLQRVYNELRAFDHAFDSVGYLLSDASQGVFKLQGLLKAISAGQQQALQDRVSLMEQSRSVIRGIAIDAGSPDGKNAEEFTRVATPFTGIPDLLDRFMQRFAAASDYPTMELFGQGGGGLNAAGEAEAATRKWYDTLASQQANELAPCIKRAFRLLSLSKRSTLKGKLDTRWKVKFHPLWAPTDDERSKTLLANAQRDTIYVADGVVKPEEIAVTLGDVYPRLDVAAREEVLEGGESFDPYPKDPEPDLPPPSASLLPGPGGEAVAPKKPRPGA